MRQQNATGPSFLRHVGLLTAGAALGPLAVLLAYPALTRLYGPAEFGVLAQFEAVLAITLTFSTLRYHLAIPMPEHDAEAAGLVVVAMAAAMLTSGLLAGAILFGADALADLLHLRSLGAMLWLLPVATLAGSVALALGGWHVRRRAFGLVAGGRVTQGAVQAAAQLAFGAAGVRAPGLLLGLTLGRVAGSAVLAMRTGLVTAFGQATLQRTLAAVRHYRQLPLVSSWSAIVHVVGQQASVLIVAASFGTGPAGLYSLAFLLTVGPTHIVCQAVEQSFAGRLREAARAHRVAEQSFAVFRAMAVAAVVPALILAVIAHDLFGLLFGTAWTAAGDHAAALVPAVVAAVVGAHLPAVVVLRRWQRAELVFNVALATARCAALWWGATTGDIALAVLGYGGVSAVLTLGYSGALLVVLGIRPRVLAATLGRELLLGALIALPFAGLRMIGGDGHHVAVTLLGVAIAAGWLLLAARRSEWDVDPSRSPEA